MMGVDYVRTTEMLVTGLFGPGNLVHGVKATPIENLPRLFTHGLLPNAYLQRMLPECIVPTRTSYVPWSISFSMLPIANNRIDAYFESDHFAPQYERSELPGCISFGIVTTPTQLLKEYGDKVKAQGTKFAQYPERYNVQNGYSYGIPIGKIDKRLCGDEVVVNFPQKLDGSVTGFFAQNWKTSICASRNSALCLKDVASTFGMLRNTPFLYFDSNDRISIL